MILALPTFNFVRVGNGPYFQALTAFGTDNAGPIIRELAMASRIAASTGTQLVDDIVWQKRGILEILDGYDAQIRRMTVRG